jgi:NAD-dependent dihydropyrimidine dehydrogenase PreA subunit
MCEFCHKHGDGKKWYLQARNYSADLLSDLRRQEIVREVLLTSKTLTEGFRGLDRLERAPAFVQRAVKGWVTRRQKRDHFGQVVPIEDVEEILGFVNSVVQVPCICRYINTHQEAGYCYGVTVNGGDEWRRILARDPGQPTDGPDFSDVQQVDAQDALRQLREHEKEGLCHTVWTFGTPFIGGLCNCDRVDCLAMQATVQRGVSVFFRAEYVAELDPDLCTGCRSCMRLCQFGAIGYSALNKRAFVDPRACYGCGVCRTACSQGALRLRARADVPAAARLW